MNIGYIKYLLKESLNMDFERLYNTEHLKERRMEEFKYKYSNLYHALELIGNDEDESHSHH
jgi:hypothetical protein